MRIKNDTFNSDLCSSFTSYEDSSSNPVTETNQVVKVVEHGMLSQ
jgi:hypothetical protein